jgi:GAF domain-containing protein
MKLVRPVESALELLEGARRQLESRPDGVDPSGVRVSLEKLDEQLRELLTLCGECEIRHAVLQSIASVKDPEEALVASLTYLTQHLDVDASGLRLRDGDDFPYFTTSGFSRQFVLDENSLCQTDSCGAPVLDGLGNVVLECMCGNVVQGRFDPSQPFFTSRGSFWTNSTSNLIEETTEADRLGRTRDRCRGEGYESVALIPLRSGDETFGLLQFNDHDPGKFTPQTIALLEDISEYLARLLV